MADDVDKLFEDFFGFGESKPKPKKPPAAPTPPVEKGTVEDAAKAVRAALVAHTGRKRPVGAWRKVAAEVLGLKRLVSKRWEEVLDKGIELELFFIDEESLSYPTLIPLEPEPEPEPVPEKEPDPDRWDEEISKGPSPHPPKDWDPIGHLPCGHWEWQYTKPTDQVPRKGLRIRKVEDCLCCQRGEAANPQFQAPEYRTPVPKRLHRTVEKDGSMGWPGYCVDDEGYYIGGIANHCRMANPKGPHCAVHRRKKRES